MHLQHGLADMASTFAASADFFDLLAIHRQANKCFICSNASVKLLVVQSAGFALFTDICQMYVGCDVKILWP